MKRINKDGIITTTKLDTTDLIYVSYINENEFNKGVKALKKYNKIAYKDFVFIKLPKIRAGEFIGTNNGNYYECPLTSDSAFEFVHGKVYVTYLVDGNNVVLTGIEPSKFLTEGHKKEAKIYKGVPALGPLDIFKIDYYFTNHKYLEKISKNT